MEGLKQQYHTLKFYPKADLDYPDVSIVDSATISNKYNSVTFGKNILIGKNVKIGSKTSIGSNTIIEKNATERKINVIMWSVYAFTLIVFALNIALS